ncbi:MAG: hypothetical protein U0838_16765 [Chloroflexota bacterium]
MPVVLDIAEAASRRAAKGAWIVDFTNPVGIVTRALLDDGHRALGLCNVPSGSSGVSPRTSTSRPSAWSFRHVGSTTSPGSAIRVDGVDRLPGLLAASDRLADEVELPADLLRALGALLPVLPALLLRHADGGRGTAHRASSRAAEVAEIERGLLDLYRRPDAGLQARAARAAGQRPYSEAAAQLIACCTTARATSRSSMCATTERC